MAATNTSTSNQGPGPKKALPRAVEHRIRADRRRAPLPPPQHRIRRVPGRR